MIVKELINELQVVVKLMKSSTDMEVFFRIKNSIWVIGSVTQYNDKVQLQWS